MKNCEQLDLFLITYLHWWCNTGIINNNKYSYWYITCIIITRWTEHDFDLIWTSFLRGNRSRRTRETKNVKTYNLTTLNNKNTTKISRKNTGTNMWLNEGFIIRSCLSAICQLQYCIDIYIYLPVKMAHVNYNIIYLWTSTYLWRTFTSVLLLNVLLWL